MESESVYKIKNNRVYGLGQSYQCTNHITAKQLQQTLNTYHATTIRNKQAEQLLDKITKKIIQMQRTVSILTDEVEQIRSILDEH